MSKTKKHRRHNSRSRSRSKKMLEQRLKRELLKIIK